MHVFPYGERETAHLARRDKRLGLLIAHIGPIERAIDPDLFTALLRSIVAQQISSKAAVTVFERLRALAGEVTPERIAALAVEDIQACGMSMRKAGYIKSTAEAALSGALDVPALKEKSDEEIIAVLSALNGVGVWTAEMLLIFSLARPDVLSWGDLAVRRGIMKLYGLQTLTRQEFERLRKRWSPCGSTASLYLWHYCALPDELPPPRARAAKH